jgi:hypothetical protein
MEWKNNLTRTPYLVLFIILISVGVTSAFAINITLGGTVDITQILDMMGNRITNVGTPTASTDAATKEYVDQAPSTDTLALLGCNVDQVARWNGSQWICNNLVIQTIQSKITTVDSAGNIGIHTSIAIGNDGFPVISYNNFTSFDLKVAKCINEACTGTSTITTVDSVGDVGKTPSIAIGNDGFPVISYEDDTNKNLKVVKCGNISCSNSNIITTVDTTGNVGLYTSIAIGNDGFPVISYLDGTNWDLKVAKCINQACTGTSTITAVDSVDTVGAFTSIAIGNDGFPVISYFDQTNWDLKVAKCINQACTGTSTITAVDSADDVGQGTSIAIGNDGFPVISYKDSTNADLKVAKCINQACTGTSTITAVDTVGSIGSWTSIAIGDDGFPVIGYRVDIIGDLKVAKCVNASCTGVSTINAVDTEDDVGFATSIAIGNDGFPVISYYDSTNEDLKVFKDGGLIMGFN